MLLKSFSLQNDSIIKPFKKTIKVDSDKSLSIRSFLIGAISQDISKISNVLESEDVLSTINCLKKLGVPGTIDRASNFKRDYLDNSLSKKEGGGDGFRLPRS